MFIRRILFKLPLQAQDYVVFKSHAIIDLKKLPQVSPFSNKAILNTIIAPEEVDPTTQKPIKKKTAIVPKITLLTGNDMSISTLEEAERLAKRRDLKLVKMIDLDTKTSRPVYRLMTGAEYHEEDLKQREKKKADKQKAALAFKGEKLLMISQNISEHDLQTHVNKIIKWLAKRYEVRIVINGNMENYKKAEAIYSFLEKNLTAHGRVVQKRQKGSDMKFQVIPPKQPMSTGGNSEDKGGTTNNDPV